MIVYRSWSRRVDVPAALASLPGDPDERLIALGEIEAGAADALSPDRDDSMDGAWPRTIEVSVPEGYAYYALYPEAYRLAARRFHEEQRPDRVVAIGIRSIGASLSTAMAETLAALGCEIWRTTVRPRGHPFDRHLRLTERLERELSLRSDWWFAIADEGPGISGSSFACVAAKLNELGIPDGRIVFFPSWETDGAQLRSARARDRWPRHRRYVVPFEQTRMGKRLASARDLSGGCWRNAVLPRGAGWPAVQPQHERRKYLLDGRWFRFAGLGAYGRDKLRFMEGEFDDGFLATQHVEGEPLRAPEPLLRPFVVRHLAARAQIELPRGAGWEELCELIEVNTREGLGDAWAGRLTFLVGYRSAFEEAPACAIDGRLQAHEWLRTRDGFVKMDVCDHHADHFFPGPQNIAWDAAGAAIELDLALPGAALPFYRTAYAAFRLGYATMAAEALGDSPDGERFERLAGRYRGNLRSLIATRGERWR
jgi:hypothetical protein